MHHTISDSSIQPTQRTSKSAPKFLPESQDVRTPILSHTDLAVTRHITLRPHAWYPHGCHLTWPGTLLVRIHLRELEGLSVTGLAGINLAAAVEVRAGAGAALGSTGGAGGCVRLQVVH